VVAVAVLDKLAQAVLVALVLSSSLTQAHNNLVVAQSHLVVVTLFTHSPLVVY
jgi:hypothetical protein